MEEFPFKYECYQIIGSCMEVHKSLGPGFLEAVYQEALTNEFEEAGIPFVKEKILDVWYKGKMLQKKYVADFLCFNEVIVELKAMDGLNPEHIAQVLNYLKACNKKIGLLINFGNRSLQYKRVIL
ncbi:MAG: GxxExxY protein [Bacteroidales bacterium]|nr:GxxExxY protein [Bacteroidales bacterium]